MSIAKKIPDEPSKQIVDTAFSVLCGLESFEIFKDQLLSDLRNLTPLRLIPLNGKTSRHGWIGGRGLMFSRNSQKHTVYCPLKSGKISQAQPIWLSL